MPAWPFTLAGSLNLDNIIAKLNWISSTVHECFIHLIHSFSHYDSEDISITDFSVLRSKGTVFFTKEAAVEHFELTENIPAPEGYEVYSAWSSTNSDLGAVNYVKTINQ